MKVSIVTPVYNEPRIRHTLDSIHAQEGIPELESVVVNGASGTDARGAEPARLYA